MARYAHILYRLSRFLAGVPPEVLGAVILVLLVHPAVLGIVVWVLSYVFALIAGNVANWYLRALRAVFSRGQPRPAIRR